MTKHLTKQGVERKNITIDTIAPAVRVDRSPISIHFVDCKHHQANLWLNSVSVSISMSNHYQISTYLSTVSIYLHHSISILFKYISHMINTFFCVAIFSIVIPWDSSVTCSSSATLGASDGWGSIHVIHLDEGVVHLPGGDEDLDEGG